MKEFKTLLLGKPLDPLKATTRSSIVLIAFFAWIGLGSDGLSSANYGPEMAFRALGDAHLYLAVYIAIMMAATVFIIALSYNQVIELFPNGGGGYKVANRLLHPYAGVVSGIALIIDYILTIAISVSAASDAVFSLLPSWLHGANLYFKLILLILLTWLNLRGMKESIKVLAPIFIGFVLTHVALLIYGIIAHNYDYHNIYSYTISESRNTLQNYGWLVLLSLIFKAYSMGAGTYTGLEAVSNNVNILAEPRVKTGKYTMFYMALSLSLVAGGITLCYLLWQVTAVEGQTFNAILFHKILGNSWVGYTVWIITMLLEAGILLLGANTGFLGGPAVLSNMAVDKWLPGFFSSLSSRLVRQNTILFFGAGSLLIVALLDGHVDELVVLYSTSVFLTFSITLFALMRYWWQRRQVEKIWFRKCGIAFLGCFICVFILCVTVIEKMTSGSWLTLVIVLLFVYICLRIKRYYAKIRRVMNKYSVSLGRHLVKNKLTVLPTVSEFSNSGYTGVIILDEYRGLGVHTLLNAIKMFPENLENFVFLKVGKFDNSNLNKKGSIDLLQKSIDEEKEFFLTWAVENGLNAKFYSKISVNVLGSYKELIDKVVKEEQNCLFFAGRIIARKFGLVSRILDFPLVLNLQNQLNSIGHNLMIMPMKIFV